MKKCNGCKKNLHEDNFIRKNKKYARCNNCSINTSFKKNICKVCGIRATFNDKGCSWGKFCNDHKEIGMINIKTKICEYNNCKKQSIFNYDGENKGKFCNEHKEIGMINIKSKICDYDGCKKQPSFNFQGENNAKFCSTHKEIGMINITHKLCEYNECKKISNFNYEGETKGKFCNEHKEECMIDINHKKCEYTGCKKQPSFNYEGETKGKFCNEHKENGMIDVKSKKCEYICCKKRPTFNYEGEKKARFCNNHKEEGMINIKDKCEYIDCKKIPTFNYEGEKKARFCNNHKEEGMVDVTNKKCEYYDCQTRPNFNYEGEKKARFCNEHKEIGMINIMYKLCEYYDCNTRSSYGYCGNSPSHCSQHKLDYMITKPKRTCIGNNEEDCKEIAIYGKDEPLYCEEHKSEDYICWLVKKCEHCGRDKELLNKEGLCGICCDKPFYEESKRKSKVKETIMVKYLRENIKDGNEILADKIIDSTCNLYRPDILYDCGTHIIVVECDENQHKNYNWESCSLNKSLEHAEEKRMYEIMIAYGLPTIFLRWNPDSFVVNETINKKYNNNKRLEILVKWVKYCMKIDITSGVIYKKLFFDEYKESDIIFKTIKEEDLISFS